MAVKDMDFTNPVIDIHLLNGESFTCCDISLKPMGDNESVISCWHEGKLIGFPMSQVKSFAFYEKP